MPRIRKPSDKVLRKNRRRFRSRVSPKQQKIAASTIALLSVFILFSMMALPYNSIRPTLRKDKNLNAEILNLQAPPPEEVEERDYGTCNVRKGAVPDHPIQSTFTASYPGSGAKMTWKLIEALTGIVTGDDHNLNGHKHAVSIKTHYPSNEGRAIDGSEGIPRAFLLIRSPLHSIPSYFNFLYEYENNLPGHSTKAPLEEWIKWRNNNFEKQVQVWRRHAEYWMDAYDKLHRSVISYERLTDDEKGPNEAMKLAEFLNRSDGVSTVPPEEVPCVWYAIVKYKERRRLQVKISHTGNKVRNDKGNKEEGPEYYDPDANVLYLSENGEGSKTSQKTNRPPPNKAPRGPMSNEQSQIGTGEHPKPPSKQKSSILYSRKKNNEEGPKYYKEEKVPDKQMLEGKRRKPSYYNDKKPESIENQQGMGGKPSSPQGLRGSEGAQGTQSGNMVGDVQSKRGGPDYVAPFNQQQLKDLIQVLTQLLERYRDDKDLAPILVSYIEEVAKRSRGPSEDENTIMLEN